MIVKTILDELYSFVKTHDCDTLLVTESQTDFTVIQKIRKEREDNFSELSVFLKDKAEDFAKSVMKNEISLFIGGLNFISF